MKALFKILSTIAFIGLLSGCLTQNKSITSEITVRKLKDTIGFAQYPWQMDSIMARIGEDSWDKIEGEPWKMAVCPHDDYSYVGNIYPAVLHNIKSDVVIILGVAHKGAALGLEDSLIFDTHTYWKGPWKNVKVSDMREDLIDKLEAEYMMISDTMHRVEHSLESLIPFLQYYNRDVEIVPILVPAMSPVRMEESGRALAESIKEIAAERNWVWGEDYSILVTTDAVHYGNEEWGGKNYARFGCDDTGNQKARDYEKEIIDNCLEGSVALDKIKLFSDYTIDPQDYKSYKWTWCGRYCVPLTMYTTYYMNTENPLSGEFINYSTSITNKHIPVDDIGMGRTAIASDCHWVGYAALGYR